MTELESRQASRASATGMSLQVKFTLGMFIILFGLTALLSYGLYRQLEQNLIDSVDEKSRIILHELEATRQYVRDTLRPKISSIVSSDEFILEAMSTSYVTRKIMERFREWYPDFSYRRVARNPRNPGNIAGRFEIDYMNRLERNRNLKEWQGIRTIGGERFFVRMTPLFMEKGCLRCHGNPQDSPKKLIQLYGSTGGFGRKLGDVAGMDVLSFPVESAMGQIWNRAVWLYGTGTLVVLVIFLLTSLLFKGLVVRRLAKLKGFFNEFVSDRKGLERRLEVDQKDEIGEVYQAFNLMADRLEDLVVQRGYLLQDCYAQQEKINTVFDAITDRLVLLAPDYTILMANTPANGGRKEFREPITCYSYFYNLDTPCKGCSFEQVLNAKRPILGEMTLGDGETYLSQFYPIMDPQTGEVTSLVHYYKSITEKKRMEQHMMQAEKLASLGQLVAGVAHELNNPLGIILFYSGLLKNELPEGSEHLEDVKVIEKHGETCKTIVEDLLNFSRTVETRTEEIDLNESVEKVLTVLEKQFAKDNVSIEKHFDRNIPLIPLDQTKIQQVWMNVLLNAKQSIKGDGTIVVKTVRDIKGERVAVVVSDDGEGMSPDIRRMIFDPFFTTKETGEGTGLGLSVSYGIVKQHGGDIEVTSAPGAGSIFRVWLPEKEIGNRRA